MLVGAIRPVVGVRRVERHRTQVGLTREPIDVRAEGVPDAVLQDAYDRFGQALLNTRSTTWRGLSEDERAQPELTLLRQHPALMKRPLITLGDKMFLSWSSEIESDLKATL